MKLSKAELTCAQAALKVVIEAGGFITFRDYDARMGKITYFAPINWCQGWGDPILHKKNTDTLCAFAAVEAGLLIQHQSGYKVMKEG